MKLKCICLLSCFCQNKEKINGRDALAEGSVIL